MSFHWCPQFVSTSHMWKDIFTYNYLNTYEYIYIYIYMYISLTPWGGIKDLHKKKHHQSLEPNLKKSSSANPPRLGCNGRCRDQSDGHRHAWDVCWDITMPLQLGLELEDESVLPLCVFFLLFFFADGFFLVGLYDYVFLFIVFWEVVGVFLLGEQLFGFV